MVGYRLGMDGYKVYFPDCGKVYFRSDVTFDERMASPGDVEQGSKFSWKPTTLPFWDGVRERAANDGTNLNAPPKENANESAALTPTPAETAPVQTNPSPPGPTSTSVQQPVAGDGGAVGDGNSNKNHHVTQQPTAPPAESDDSGSAGDSGSIKDSGSTTPAVDPNASRNPDPDIQLAPGSRVVTQFDEDWFPGTVLVVEDQRMQVLFDDGETIWVTRQENTWRFENTDPAPEEELRLFMPESGEKGSNAKAEGITPEPAPELENDGDIPSTAPDTQSGGTEAQTAPRSPSPRRYGRRVRDGRTRRR